MLFSPDLFIVGGGVSKSHEEFLPLLKLRTPIVPAALRNNAGIMGAAALRPPRPQPFDTVRRSVLLRKRAVRDEVGEWAG